MAKRRNTKKNQEQDLVEVVETKETRQDFVENNQKTIIYVALALALLIGAYFAYKSFIKEPAEKAAMESLYKAESQFAQDSFALALDNPGDGNDGFLTIIDNYGSTKAGNLAKYYAGVSYLNLGRFQDAIDYLEDFSPAGKVSPIMKNGVLGDAYSELNDLDKALSFYKKAGFNSDNELLTPYYLRKYGALSEVQGDKDAAINAYKEIKSKYPDSSEGQSIDKYLAPLM